MEKRQARGPMGGDPRPTPVRYSASCRCPQSIPAWSCGCCEPIWSTKTETANRVRGRIEALLSWAKVYGYRDGENPRMARPSRPSPALAQQGRRRSSITPPCPTTICPHFMRDLRERDGVAALALEFTILTASRTSETLNATWSEFDLDNAIWIVPAERMKGGSRASGAPVKRAVAIVKEMRDGQAQRLRVPGARRGKPMSNMAMTTVLAPDGARRPHRPRLPQHLPRHGRQSEPITRARLPRPRWRTSIGDKTEAAYAARRSPREAAAADDRMGRLCRQPRHDRRRDCAAMTTRKTTPHLRPG